MPAVDHDDGDADAGGGLYEVCLADGCTWAASWPGGSAADDPAIGHLQSHPDHTVRGGATDTHWDAYERQQNGENVTRSDFDG